MPPYFAAPHFPLARLPVTTKVALTVFSTCMVAGMIFVAVSVFEDRTGFTTEGVQRNYLGSEEMHDRTGRFQEETAPGRPPLETAEFIVHPHSFMIPLIFFVLCHMMEMTAAPKWLKLSVYIGSGVSMLAVIFTPALIHSFMGAAVLLVPAVVILFLSFGIMTVLPAVQMWLPEKK